MSHVNEPSSIIARALGGLESQLNVSRTQPGEEGILRDLVLRLERGDRHTQTALCEAAQTCPGRRRRRELQATPEGSVGLDP